MSNDSFKEFVAEQLEEVREVSIHSMFGGYGIYAAGSFFGIIHKGRLYFRVSDQTRAAYEGHGSSVFKPSRKMTLKSFYEVPADILESRPQITEWAENSIRGVNAEKEILSMQKSSNKICKAINTKGKKCRVPAAKGSVYCFRHQRKR